MRENYNNACTVIVEDGQHILITPKGERINNIIFTRVYDDLMERTALVKLYVNLDRSSDRPIIDPPKPI
jgi:hypothetical protein